MRAIYRRLREGYGSQGWWPTTAAATTEPRYHPGDTARQLSEEERWEVVVGAVLTQNTTWLSATKAIRSLQERKSLQPARLARLSLTELSRLIRPSRYHNQKARRLHDIASYVLRQYAGSVNAFLDCGPPPGIAGRGPHKSDEQLRQELLYLDGIGPETADSILLYAAQRPAFVIDAYTRRICARLGFVERDITYEKLQALFVASLKENVETYNEFHALLVRHAIEHCRQKPVCDGCCLRRSCHYGKAAMMIKPGE